MTNLRLIKSIGRSPSRLALLLIPLVFVCFALPQSAQAVYPPPDGGYQGGNTAEGQNALQGTFMGTYNTAVGCFSLYGNTTGHFNTGVGAGALFLNIGMRILPLAYWRFLATLSALTTRPLGRSRCKATPRAISTSPWAITPLPVSPRAATTSP